MDSPIAGLKPRFTMMTTAMSGKIVTILLISYKTFGGSRALIPGRGVKEFKKARI